MQKREEDAAARLEPLSNQDAWKKRKKIATFSWLFIGFGVLAMAIGVLGFLDVVGSGPPYSTPFEILLSGIMFTLFGIVFRGRALHEMHLLEMDADERQLLGTLGRLLERFATRRGSR